MIFSSFPFCFSSSLTFGVLELRGRDFFSRSVMLLGKEGKRLRNNEAGEGVSFKKSNTRTLWDI